MALVSLGLMASPLLAQPAAVPPPPLPPPPPKIRYVRPFKAPTPVETTPVAPKAPEPGPEIYPTAPSTPVFDQAGDLTITLTELVMASSAQPVLRERLAQFKQKHGEPIAVLIMPSLHRGFESMEEYAPKVAKKWGVGQADAGSGLLVVVAIGQRGTQAAMSFAPGLTARLNEQARQELLKAFLDQLRDAELAAGLTQIIDSMEQLLLPPPVQVTQ